MHTELINKLNAAPNYVIYAQWLLDNNKIEEFYAYIKKIISNGI